MDIFNKILSLLNKPTHYLFAGGIFIFWAKFIEKNLHSSTMFIGLILLSLAFASFVEWCFKNINKLIQLQKYKTLIINKYNEAQSFEKNILNHCIENNTLTYTTNPFEDDIINAIQSLSFKELGISCGQGTAFALYENVLEILKDKKDKDAKKR